MLIFKKDDIQFVTEFPCFLGHPVVYAKYTSRYYLAQAYFLIISVITYLFHFLLRSDRFTKQSFATENKFLPKTVLNSFFNKLERNLMQGLIQ